MPQLSNDAKTVVENARNTVMVSAVSIWEIAIKKGLGKLDLPEDWFDALCEEPFEHLSVTFEHAHKVDDLPNLHRDPFDRLLVAQAAVKDATLVSHDDILFRYGVPYLKA